MVAVDTNILVRLFAQDVPDLARKAERVIYNASNTSLLLDRLILAEFNYVLQSQYKFSKHDIVRLMKSLLGDERFSVSDRGLVEMTVSLFGAEKPLSFEDCWLLALKKSGKVTEVATFDNNLIKRVSLIG